ncbi:helix-turn-helix domain-containing protein [Enterococcus sp. LJL51]|uniref:helix-turn-helix domain-containing protein n=1 Tax=Enterococcus sp. LJL51 TaxID=3416656 RepID=UPI003CF3CFD2
MKRQELQAIYPNASWHTHPADNQKYLSFPDKDGFLWIEKEKLTENEQALLKLLTAEASIDLNTESLWYQFLFQKKDYSKTGRFRIIQIQIQSPEEFQADIWKEHVEGIFSNTEDFFFLTPNQAILVEKQTKYALSKEELEGIFLTLDDDFSTLSRLFIGQFHESSKEFPKLFEEEQEIFREEVRLVKRKKVFGISDVALHYFTKEALAKSALTQSMKEEWHIDEEMKEIIQALWTNQGNLSSTAKELFMHRNTLQYRLEKFQEQTGMNLKNTDELILCFLLLND